jgi:hypothetical protein
LIHEKTFLNLDSREIFLNLDSNVTFSFLNFMDFLITAFALHVRVKSLSLSSFPQACYLTMLSVSRVYSIDERMINEYDAIGGMRIGSRN